MNSKFCSQRTSMMSLDCKNCDEHYPDNVWSFFFFLFLGVMDWDTFLKGEPEVQTDTGWRWKQEEEGWGRGLVGRRWCWWWFTPCLMGGWLKLIPKPPVWGLTSPCSLRKRGMREGGYTLCLSFFFLLCIYPSRRPQTGRVTQLTPRWPPHAQSGLISCYAKRSLATAAAAHTTAGARGCPLCLHGWAEETSEGAWGRPGWGSGR